MEGSRHSLQIELGERAEEGRQPVLKLQLPKAKILKLDMEKLRCQLTGEKDEERLRQAVKEQEKKLEEQMEVKTSQGRIMVKNILHEKEQVEMLRGSLTPMLRASPGGRRGTSCSSSTPRPRARVGPWSPGLEASRVWPDSDKVWRCDRGVEWLRSRAGAFHPLHGQIVADSKDDDLIDLLV